MRCPDPCGKVRYESRYKAMLAAIRLAIEEEFSAKPYRSNICGCWHLTAHRGERDRGGKTIQKVKRFTKEGKENG